MIPAALAPTSAVGRSLADPWRYSKQGIGIAVRVTPRGGRDEIDGTEQLANGNNVVKLTTKFRTVLAYVAPWGSAEAGSLPSFESFWQADKT